MINGYCKAYLLRTLQSFPAWYGRNDTGETLEEEDTICYLWDDFVVRSSPIERKHRIFDATTPEWISFCEHDLQFKVPEEIVHAIQTAEQEDALSSPHRKAFFPFTSGQQWLIEELSSVNKFYFNIVIAQMLPQPVSTLTLINIMAHMMEYHDALRICIAQSDDMWQQWTVETLDAIPFTWVHTAHLSLEDQQKVLGSVSLEMQRHINTLQGYLWHTAFCETGYAQNGCMLIAINHFIFDNFSKEILAQSFSTLYQQALQGKKLRLPPQTTSLRQWAQRMAAYLHTPEAEQEIQEYWLTLPWHRVRPLPLDFPEGCSVNPYTGRTGYGTLSSSRSFILSFGSADAAALLTRAVNRHTQPLDLFLTALALTFTAWNHSSVLSVFVQDHARIPLFRDIDLLRTVGFIAHARRLLLDLYTASSPLDALEAIKRQLRQAPNNGRTLDWFLRRGDGAEIPEALKCIPFADLHFQFRGRITSPEQNDAGGFPSLPVLSYPQALRNHVVNCGAMIVDDDIQFIWEYSESIHLSSTIESLAARFLENLRELVALLVCETA